MLEDLWHFMEFLRNCWLHCKDYQNSKDHLNLKSLLLVMFVVHQCRSGWIDILNRWQNWWVKIIMPAPIILQSILSGLICGYSVFIALCPTLTTTLELKLFSEGPRLAICMIHIVVAKKFRLFEGLNHCKYCCLHLGCALPIESNAWSLKTRFNGCCIMYPPKATL